MELERQRNILIIGHQAILRCIYAYFMNHSHEKLPYIKIPLHTVIQLTPSAYTCEEKRFKVDIEAVDTHRPKPKAGAPKSATDSNPETPGEAFATADAAKPAGADGEKDCGATITTTTMSTTTFRDSAFNRTKNAHRASRDARADESLEKAKVLQSALTEATAGDSLANPAVALHLDEIKTPVPAQEQEASETGILDEAAPTLLNALPSPAAAGEASSPHKVTKGFDAQPASSAGDSTTAQLGNPPPQDSNLSINTSLLTTPPMQRYKGDLQPAAAWQEGTEYERRAGASPRDPVMSPGGRLLPKKENFHFPVSLVS